MNDYIFQNPEDVILHEIDKAASKINCAKIGKILAVKDDNSVNVELEDGTLINCLLFQLAGYKAFIDFEDYAGIDCLVVFCDSDLSRFKSKNSTLPDIDKRAHTLNNGIAIPGVFPFNNRINGKNHFVSYEQLNDILTDWSNDLLNALKAATVPQTASGTAAYIIWTAKPLPDKIDVSDSQISGITHND